MSDTGKVFGITEGILFTLILFYASAAISFSITYVLVGLLADVLANAISVFNEQDVELQEKLNLYKQLFGKREKPKLLEKKGRKDTILATLRAGIFTFVGGFIVLIPAFFSVSLAKIVAPIIAIAIAGYMAQSVETDKKSKAIAIVKITLSIIVVITIISAISYFLRVNPA
jgi:uncharacterized membrane protein